MNAGPETWRSVLIWYQKPISSSLPDHLSNPFNTITSCGPVGFLGRTMALVPKEGLKASTAEVRNVLCTGVRRNALQAEDVSCIKEVVQAHADWAESKTKFFGASPQNATIADMLLTFWSLTYRWANAICYKLGSRKKLPQMYCKTVFSKDVQNPAWNIQQKFHSPHEITMVWLQLFNLNSTSRTLHAQDCTCNWSTTNVANLC